MDPIDGLPPAGPIAPAAPRRGAGGGGFRVAAETVARPADGLVETDSVAETAMAGLLALQEGSDGGAVRDRNARRRGHDLLAELAALQRDLLAGGPGQARLARLLDLADAVPLAADPRLRDAVAAIALRAQVEAARYGAG